MRNIKINMLKSKACGVRSAFTGIHITNFIFGIPDLLSNKRMQKNTYGGDLLSIL